ncbi:MAG TPA: AraC family transcriptional regulator [Pseudoxanthomonas sp.]|nr:AraC family transcriptional regulator [Pseudoxanthomonas sp.]
MSTLSASMLSAPAVRICDLVLRPGQAMVLHGDECAWLLVLLSGAATLEVGDIQLALSPQRAAWLPAGATYRLDCRKDAVLRELRIEPVPPDMLADLRGVEPTTLLLALLEALLEDLHADNACAPVHGRHDAVAALLLDEIARLRCFQTGTRLPRDPRLRRICQAILEDPANDRQINDWACAAGLSRRTLTRLCRVELGVGLAAWRQQVRLKAAAAHLARGVAVSRTADRVGYNSVGNFSRTFRRMLGVHPSRFARPD